MHSKSLLFLAFGFLLPIFVLTSRGQNRATESYDNEPESLGVNPNPQPQFAPSNARTADGRCIAESDFFPSSRCAGCHHDTHASWSQSLHRNAAREPFYRESVDILLHTRGIEPTRHCESCHTPVALFSGALTHEAVKQEAPFTALDDEGVTCSVCHSIVGATVNGTGSYTIRRPALLANEDGTPRFGNFTDEQILADIPAHKRAVMRPLLKTPKFCSTCHKVTAPPDLNGYKQIKGFTVYDEWQQSGASLEAVLPYYRRDARADCRTCHMPKVESSDDRAAKNGMIASHRWLGANTAVPLLYNQTQQASAIEEFLKAKVLDVDIFAVKRDLTGEHFAPLSTERQNAVRANPGEEVTVEVVVSNRGAAHSFPPEVRDLYEAWVGFEAIDSAGKPVFQSGVVKPDGMLDEGAHVYKAILVDQNGRVITRHQIWRTTIKAYDNAIPAGRSDIVRYRFRLPQSMSATGSVGLTLYARVNYRRFNNEYTGFILSRRGAQLAVPVVQMAETESKVVFEGDRYEARAASMRLRDHVSAASASALGSGGPASALGSGALLSPAAVTAPGIAAKGTATATAVVAAEAQNHLILSRRWNDYGIALFEQAQYGPAALAFLHAANANPLDANPLVSAAGATLKTERFGEQRLQLAKAAELIDRAIAIDAQNPRARFYLAWVRRAQGKGKEAAEIWAKLAGEYPRDREVQRQLGQTLLQIGYVESARAAFEAVIAVDPQDAGAYQYLASTYATLGRKSDSERAMLLYHQWREDPMAQAVANRFYMAHPEWSDERIPSHTHGDGAPRRPVLTGSAASPY
jgi:tetratricopeptide (TPR) repeat protein